MLLDLISENCALTVIGDEDQSIYESLRHAHPEGIIEFNQTHDNTIDIPIDECRRCPTRIVLMANHLIHNNVRRSDRDLLPRQGNIDGNVLIAQWPTIEMEADGIANYICRKINEGEMEAGQVLVLSPRRHLGYMIRDFLIQRGCNAHSFFSEEVFDGNPKQLETCRTQEAFSLLALLVNLHDRVALRSWLGFGSPSLRTNEYNRLREYCVDQNVEPIDVLELIVNGDVNIPNTRNIQDRYLLLRQSLTQIEEFTDREKFDFVFPLSEDWTEMIRSIAENNLSDDEWTLDTIINTLRLNITQPELPSEVEYVRVMSLQKSKGLSADHVFVLGCIQGLIPSFDSGLSPQETQRIIEEQRRLFYVAITRAKQSLVISNSIMIPRNLAYQMGARVGRGGNRELVPTIASNFIRELGPQAPNPIIGPELVNY
ncbi:MAG: ATP-dependent helicase [Anaerolineales bacterium]|nr:ATP-dependent helicase [Anaerolineales bacterium]